MQKTNPLNWINKGKIQWNLNDMKKKKSEQITIKDSCFKTFT